MIAPELERMERGGGYAAGDRFQVGAAGSGAEPGTCRNPRMCWWRKLGPEHSKTFTVEARLHTKNGKNAEFVGRAQGSTKKTAEQDAARQLLTFLASRPKAADAKGARASSPADK